MPGRPIGRGLREQAVRGVVEVVTDGEFKAGPAGPARLPTTGGGGSASRTRSTTTGACCSRRRRLSVRSARAIIEGRATWPVVNSGRHRIRRETTD